jgi:hypothetical protein
MDDAEKRAIEAKRVENRKLSEIIQQGTCYHEMIKVKAIDGEEHEVEVYALSENDFRQAFEGTDIDPRDIGNKEKLVQNMKYLLAVAEKATHDPQIGSVLMPNECSKIMMKAFELSGLTGTSAGKVESFQSRDIQP